MRIKKRDFYFTTKLDLTEVLKEELENGEEAWIEVSEPDLVYSSCISDAHKKGSGALAIFIKQELPKLIVNHNFIDEDGKEYKASEVVDYLFKFPEAVTFIVGKLSDRSFFTTQKAKKQD